MAKKSETKKTTKGGTKSTTRGDGKGGNQPPK